MIDLVGWLQVIAMIIAITLVWSSNRYLVRVIRYNRELERPIFQAAELGVFGIAGGALLAGFTLAMFVARTCPAA